jgi:hypothetical protein
MANRSTPTILNIFNELVRQGHITPVEHMEDLRLPGEFVSVPTVVTYATPDIPILAGAHDNAKLEQRAKGNLTPSGDIY